MLKAYRRHIVIGKRIIEVIHLKPRNALLKSMKEALENNEKVISKLNLKVIRY